MATLFDMEPLEESGLKLNNAQKCAITHGEGPLLVIAGAGTGKTRVITERIRHLLQSDETLSGENILGLTFTKKAAGEMKGRVVKATGERGKAVRLATFHSFCETLLAEADPQRVMLDQFDHWILLRRNLRRLRLDKYRRLADPGQFLNDFVEFFSRCQDELVSSEDYQQYAAGLAAHLETERGTLDEDTLAERLETVALQQELARAYRASEELLREKNRVSFGSLITGAVALLERDAPLREAQQNKYRYILVDEFQDTNIAQLRLLEMLAGPTKSVVAVGDNDQAIYRFRGASFGSFKLFLERFAGWKQGQDSTPVRVTLTENYRSTPNILRVAMQVIGQNAVSADFPKKVLTPNKPPGEKIRIVELATPEAESRWVASELERIHGAGRRWKDFAVLYRQHAHRDHLVEELSRRKIPFVITRLSILEHPLVRDALAYLRLIAAPYDDIACARVLAAPAWHLEAADLVRLAERARKEKKAIYDLLQLPQGQLAFDRSHAALGQLVEFVSSQRKTLKRSTAREILGVLTEWLEIPRRANQHDRKYVKRLAEFMMEWEPKSETRGLTEFIEYLDYYAQAGGVVSLEDDAPPDAVQLMTVHGAKGLEFPQVFLLRVNNRAFPATERPRVFEFPVELMKEGAPAEQFHIQEERRLFYVALTRAEERLTITTVTEKKGKVPVFIEDIVMDPAIKRQDVRQLMPKLPPAGRDDGVQENLWEDSELFPAAKGSAKIFSRIADWAEEFHAPAAEPLTLSPSALSGYRACPQRYLFGYLWSLREGPKAAMSFGAVMHTTIKRFVDQLRKGVKLPFEEVQRIFETEWNSKGFEDDYQEEGYKKDGLEQLRAFHAGMMEETPEALAQEKALELPLDNNVIIKGRIDQINSLGNKRDAKQLEEAQKVVQEAAADIRAGEFPAKRGFICRNCAYKPICPAHEETLST